MKNFGKILMVLVSVMLLGGCAAKFDYNVKINSDNSMEISAIAAYDDEMIDSIMSSSGGTISTNPSASTDTTQTPSYTDEERWNYLEQAFSSGEMPITETDGVKRYDKDGFKGYEATEKIDNINDITGDKANFNLDDSSNLNNTIMFVKKDGGYEASIGIDEETASSYSQYTAYGMDFEYKFVVSLPTKAGDNNATSVSDDGKTLTWDLTKFKGDSIKFVYKPSNIIMYIIIAAIVLVVIALIVVFILGKKNKNKTDSKEGTPVLVDETPVLNNLVNDTVSMASSVNTPTPSEQTESLFNAQPIPSEQTESLFNAQPTPSVHTESLFNAQPTPSVQTESLFNAQPTPSVQTESLFNAQPTPSEQTESLFNTQSDNVVDNSNVQANSQATGNSEHVENLFDSKNSNI